MFSGLSYGQISEIAANLDSKATSMETLLNAITNELKKVGGEGSSWSGTAAAAAFEEFNKLIVKFPEFKSAINECATYLRQTVERYQNVDKAVANMQ